MYRKIMMSNISENQLNNNNNNNNSNIRNGSGQNVNALPPSSTMFLNSAYNIDSISSTNLGKQRNKKRNKKKDSHKLLLTNTQTIGTPTTICSSDERCSNNINNSSHLNCQPNACACGHFTNSTLFDGNVYAQTEAHYEYDIANNNKKFAKPNKSINFWTDEIKSDDVNWLADRRQFAGVQRSDVTQQHNDHLQRFAVYENLCTFCGFAIGNGLHHFNCLPKNYCQNQLTTDKKCKNQTENIYENICKKCHSISDGEKCLNELCEAGVVDSSAENKTKTIEVIDILVKKPPIGHRQFGKQFTDFLGSFKQKLNSKPNEIERKRPNIEIIHNVDDAFKTNKTFNLNEIVQLKNSKITNVYGKLRNRSDEHLIQEACNLHPLRKNKHLIRTSTSDSNFFDTYHLGGSSHLQSPPFSESIVSDTILYSNSYAPPSYEDAIQDKYASINPFKLKSYTKPTTYDYYSTSASSFFTYDSSSVSTLQSISLEPKSPADFTLLSNDVVALEYWLTSLKQQTFDYGDDNNRQFDCDSIKCIPPKMFCEQTINNNASLSINSNINNSHPLNMTAIQLNEIEQIHLRCRVESFKKDLLKRLSKRNAIYIGDSHCINPIGYLTEIDECSDITKNNIMEIATTSQHVSPVQSSINHTLELNATAQYFQMLKTFYMTQIALSTGVNRITLVCGNRNAHFLIKILLNQKKCEYGTIQNCLNRIVYPTEYINFERIIEIIQKISIRKQLSESDKGRKMGQETKRKTGNVGKIRQKMLSIDDFVRQSTNRLLEIPLNVSKCSIDDFARKKHQISADSCNNTKTLDHFHKPVVQNLNICEKTINDFVLKKTHYSSQHTSQSTQNERKNQQTTEMNERPKNEENIYQPIWMFKTIGTANDTSYDVESVNSLNMGPTELDEIKIDDESDWERVEEEFLFSSNRIGTIKLLNSTPMISHNLDAESKIHILKRYPNNVDYYETVSILYCNNEIGPKLKNKIIYDYNVNRLAIGQAKCCSNKCVPTNKSNEADYYAHMTSDLSRSNELNTDRGQAFTSFNRNDIKIDSINAWKSMLRTIDYIDDEEDVILTETSLHDIKMREFNSRNKQIPQSVPSFGDDSSTFSTSENSIQNQPLKKSNSSMNSTTSTLSSISSISTTDSKSNRKEFNLFNKPVQHMRFDINKGGSQKEESVPVQGLFYKNLPEKNANAWKEQSAESSPPMEIKRLNQSPNSGIIFGATLDEVEKDDNFLDIPKFVVKCIRIIEFDENMQTNGIYRASGRKDSIDKLRKRMNEPVKLRKWNSKYVTLKDEDIHTITGALKQFFRELKTELIPDELVQRLPDDLENEASLVEIRNEVSTIDYLPRELLKYLLQHLRRVDANSDYNLMNASNLSIVWGASLFTSSVNMMNPFETGGLLRKNMLVRILIQRYDDIFIDIDRLI